MKMELKTIRIQRVVEQQNLASVMKKWFIRCLSYTTNDCVDGRSSLSMS